MAEVALRAAWLRAPAERVEVACTGGRGRTGTALACLAVLDGLPARDAVRHVRRHYHAGAVETPAQHWYLHRFARELDRAARGRPGQLGHNGSYARPIGRAPLDAAAPAAAGKDTTMWLFFTARIRQWLILAVALPLATLVVRGVRRAIEKRSGSTRLTRILSSVEGLGQRKRRH